MISKQLERARIGSHRILDIGIATMAGRRNQNVGNRMIKGSFTSVALPR